MSTNTRRALLVCTLLLSACEGPKGPAGRQGPEGAPGADGENGTPGTNGTNGTNGDDGAQGDQGEQGVPGEDATWRGTLAGTVTDFYAGTGVTGITVTTTPGDLEVVTGADGTYSIADVPIGVYSVLFHAAGFGDVSMTGIGIAAGLTTTLDAVVTPGNPLVVGAGNDQLAVGFGAAVVLDATAQGAGAGATWTWTQTAGPTVVLTGADTASASFTTASLEDTYVFRGRALRDRHEILGITPYTKGSYTFRVSVTDGPFTSSDTVVVDAAEPTSGLANVPREVRQFAAAAEQGSYDWALSAPAGSTAVLSAATERVTSFKPDVVGAYTLTETVGGWSQTINVGEWVGVAGNETECTICHRAGGFAPDKFTPWAGTGHATMLEEGLDGVKSDHYGASCVGCHTVGYDLSAANGGFDDAAAADGWTFPAQLAAGNWDDFMVNYPETARYGNIQCENCHGPNDGAAHTADGGRISFKASVCAQCHDSPVHHDRVEEFDGSAHSGGVEIELARDDASVDARGSSAGHCGRCHSAQGYKVYAEQLNRGFSGTIQCITAEFPGGHNCCASAGAAGCTQAIFDHDLDYLRGLGLTRAEIEPQTCAACHEPHDATNPGQLRVYGDIEMLPSGFGVHGVGAGATCMACHNTRNGARGDSFGNPSSYSGPHTPSQTDVLFGKNVYFVPTDGNESRHLAVGDTCVGCHIAASIAVEGEYQGHGFAPAEDVCTACHGELVTGEGLRGSVQNGIEDIQDAIIDRLLVNFLTPAITGAGHYYLRAWDPDTDLYSDASSNNSDVDVTVLPTSITFEHIHGQIGFSFTYANPIAVTWSDGSSTNETVLFFQLGGLRPAGTGAGMVPYADNLVKAAWNLGILEDGSEGIHNPTFVLDVIAATLAAL